MRIGCSAQFTRAFYHVAHFAMLEEICLLGPAAAVVSFRTAVVCVYVHCSIVLERGEKQEARCGNIAAAEQMALCAKLGKC
jgi:hypothetical protein